MVKLKKKKRRSLLLFFAFLVFVLYMGYHFVTVQLELNAQNNALTALQEQCEDQKLANEELENILKNGGEAVYKEKIARENGYVKPDERLFVDISGN